MFEPSSLDKFSTSLEFINIKSDKDKEDLELECSKLIYLRSYPAVVRANMREKSAQIRGLDNEISLSIKNGKSELERIKIKQSLKKELHRLSALRSELDTIKKELAYAENVKLVAGVRLGIYQEFISKYLESKGDELNNGSSGHKKQYRLVKLPRSIIERYKGLLPI